MLSINENNKTRVSPRRIRRGDKFEFLKVLWAIDEGQLKRLISRYGYVIEDLTDLHEFSNIADKDRFDLATLSANFKLPTNYKKVVEEKLIIER